MRVTIKERDRGSSLKERLRERLDRAAQLRCAAHDQTVTAVAIDAYENGWFSSRWTTCCEALTEQAASIVKERC